VRGSVGDDSEPLSALFETGRNQAKRRQSENQVWLLLQKSVPQSHPNYHEIVIGIFGLLQYSVFIVVIGAGDGNRTHDIQLGKLTFYL
jgi:hypothetical protein